MSTATLIPIPPPLPPIRPPQIKLVQLIDDFVGAAQTGDIERIKVFLDDPKKMRVSFFIVATIDSVNGHGHSALHAAYANGHTQMCAYLVSRGASIHLKTKDNICWSAYEAGKIQGGPLLTALLPKLEGKVLPSSECSICENQAALYPLDCGHCFCIDCLGHWFSTLVDQSLEITCPSRNCCIPVTSSIHLSFFLPTQQLETYISQSLRRTVATMSDFFWCPECPSGGIFPENVTCRVVSCPDCPRSWCRECSQLPHGEIGCDEARARCADEEQLCKEWKVQKTKTCPKCKTAIEKNGGCSHVRCLYCQYEFCWICLGVYVGRYTHGDQCPCK